MERLGGPRRRRHVERCASRRLASIVEVGLASYRASVARFRVQFCTTIVVAAVLLPAR